MPPRARIIAYRRNGSCVRGGLCGEVWKSCDIDNSLPVAARPQKATVIRQRPQAQMVRVPTDHHHGRLQGHRDRLAREDRVAEIKAHHLLDPDQVLLVIPPGRVPGPSGASRPRAPRRPGPPPPPRPPPPPPCTPS